MMHLKVLLILQIFFMISINDGKRYLVKTKNNVRDKGNNGSDYGYRIDRACDSQWDYNTNCGHACRYRYVSGRTNTWRACQNKCMYQHSCEHWIFHHLHTKWNGQCMMINFGAHGVYRNYDTNTVTGTCQKQW